MSPQLSTPDLFPHEGLLAAEAEQVVAETIRHWQRGDHPISAAEAWAALGHRGITTSWALPRAFMLRWWIGRAEAARAASPIVTTNVTASLNARGEAMDWFRSHHGLPTDARWLAIAKRAEVRPAEAAVIYWALLDYASQQEERGSIEGFDIETAAGFFGIDDEKVAAIIAAMTAKRLIVDERIAGWDRRQPLREDSSAERTRAWRDRKRGDAVVTQRDDAVTHGDDRTEQRRSEQSGGEPPLTPPSPTLTPDFEFREEWIEEARVDRVECGLAPADLARQWRDFCDHKASRGHASLDEAHGAWMRWARKAHAVSAAAAGPPPANGADPPRTESVEDQSRRLFWGKSATWWRKFDPSQQTRVRRWVERGEWRGKSPPPGSPGCLIEHELAEAAVAERARRLAEAPEILMPIAGGAAGAEAAAARSPPQKPPDQRRARAG